MEVALCDTIKRLMPSVQKAYTLEVRGYPSIPCSAPEIPCNVQEIPCSIE